MSVEIRLFADASGFANFPRTSSDNDKAIKQFKAETGSNNSRVVFSGKIQSYDLSVIATGAFETVTPGMTVESFFDANSESFGHDQELYLNGKLLQVTTFSVPVPVGLTADDTFGNLSQLYSGNDVIYAPTVNPRDSGIDFFGYTGNDRFFAYGAHEYDDIFYGGDGVDSLIYSAPKANYSITSTNTIWNPITEKSDSTGFFIRDNTGRDGDVQVSEVERIVFSDSAIAFDTSGIAGKAYRIYKAAFDRTPDISGLGYWINDMDNGTSLTSVAGGFIASREFQTRYGSAVSDADFITLLYENVLDRKPDQQGLDYWINDLKNGLSRAAALASFSESSENKANVAGLIANGIEYTPFIG